MITYPDSISQYSSYEVRELGRRLHTPPVVFTLRHVSNLRIFLTTIVRTFLDVAEIDIVLSISQLCFSLRQEVKSYMRSRFHDTIRPWIGKPKDFRNAMRKSNAILSGSIVLQYVMRTSWSSSNVDIYVPAGTAKWVMFQHLMTTEKYAMEAIWTDERGPPHCFGADRDDILSLMQLSKTSETPSGNSTLRINILESSDPDPFSPLIWFNTTWVMNWLTADTVGMAYPVETLERSGTYCGIGTAAFTKAELGWFTAYRFRDFSQITKNELFSRRCGAYCPALARMAYDEKCLNLTFGAYVERHAASTSWSHGGHRGSISCWDQMCPRCGLNDSDAFK